MGFFCGNNGGALRRLVSEKVFPRQTKLSRETDEVRTGRGQVDRSPTWSNPGKVSHKPLGRAF